MTASLSPMPSEATRTRHDYECRNPPRTWIWPAATAALFLALQLLGAPFSIVYPDTARYAQIALEYAGTDPDEAQKRAAQLYCADQAEHADRANTLRVLPRTVTGVEQACIAETAESLPPTADPRYHELFTTRPGYPAAAAVLTPLLGLKGALWAVPVTATLAAGLILWRLLRQAGATPEAAAIGQVLLYLLPVGWWGSRMLTEGPILLCTVTAVAGGLLLAQGRLPRGVAVLTAALAAAAAVKYSTAGLLAAALLIAAIAVWLFARPDRRGVLILGGITAAALAAITLVSARLELPGLRDSAREMLTGHYARPDVTDPLAGLVSTNIGYWSQWLLVRPSNLALLGAVAVSAVALWRWSRPLALLAAAAASTGIGVTIAHPDAGQGDRLYAPLWLLVAVGATAAVQLLLARHAAQEPSQTSAP